MERFESEHGTLPTTSLFFGRENDTGGHSHRTVADWLAALTTLPAILYLVIERGILRKNNAVVGARWACPLVYTFGTDVGTKISHIRSVWVFLLLGMEAIRTYRSNPHLVIATYHIPTWTTPLLMIFVVATLIPNTSFLGHLCGAAVGYICESSTPRGQSCSVHSLTRLMEGGLGYLKLLAPPEWALRWVETRLNLLEILPHYVSIDQKTYGRFGVLPSSNRTGSSAATELIGGSQRLGPWGASAGVGIGYWRRLTRRLPDSTKASRSMVFGWIAAVRGNCKYLHSQFYPALHLKCCLWPGALLSTLNDMWVGKRGGWLPGGHKHMLKSATLVIGIPRARLPFHTNRAFYNSKFNFMEDALNSFYPNYLSASLY